MELHFSPGVKGVEEGSAPAGCGFRPASSEVGQRVEFGTVGFRDQVVGNLEIIQGGLEFDIRKTEIINASSFVYC